MAGQNTYSAVPPAAGDKLLGIDISDTTQSASGSTANFTVGALADFVAASPGQAVLSGVAYDGANRLTAFTRSGVSHTVSYPSSTSIVIAGGGKTITITLDAQGRVTGKAVA